jgi:nicotinate-nucleotide adenylyltransferase
VVLNYCERLSLIKEAISSEPCFDVSTEDKGGTGFTADLMQKLQRKKPETRYVFVIGSDNLGTLQHWHNFTWLQKNTHFLILPRPGYQLDLDMVANIKASVLQIELSPISSTDIRAKIALGESIHGLVPDNLEKRIVQLYSSANLHPLNI